MQLARQPGPATLALVREHALIQAGLGLLGVVGREAAQGRAPEPGTLPLLVEVFTDFADGVHHHKEERLLFPAVRSAGSPEVRAALDVLEAQHEEGRRLVRELGGLARVTEWSEDARSDLTRAAQAYRSGLARHICCEDHRIFPLADGLLAGGRDELVRAAYAAGDDEGAFCAHRARLREVARRLELMPR